MPEKVTTLFFNDVREEVPAAEATFAERITVDDHGVVVKSELFTVEPEEPVATSKGERDGGDSSPRMGSILKADEDQRIVYGIVYAADDAAIAKWAADGSKPEDAPDVVDTQGEWVGEATLRKAFEGYMRHYAEMAMGEGKLPTGAQHRRLAKGVVMLQSALLVKGTCWPDADSPATEAALTWVRADHVGDGAEDLWKAIKKQELTGYSMGGKATRAT